MRRLRLLVPLLLLVVVIVSAVLVLRARGDIETGPAFALCPGPDAYGYRCEPGAVFSYIDAAADTGLYSDDGTTVVDLPFSFTFYGGSYQQVALSSNGTLQFTTENPTFTNQCLDQGPVEGMGEMIAPYWDDLDLTLFGYLETAVSGDPGARIFVIEWDDVPIFGDPQQTVTFEVQLFEGSNDIVFLYQDVTRTQGNNGRSATIGLQSVAQGNTLQFGCNQLSLTDGLVVHFPHPDGAAQEITQPALPLTGRETAVVPKGDLQLLLQRLNGEGINALRRMNAHWLAQRPQLQSQSFQADITGDGRQELILLLRPPAAFAQQTQIAVFGQEDNRWELRYHTYPLARQDSGRRLSLDEIVDKTADGISDILIRDETTGDAFVLSASAESFEMISSPAP